MEMGAVVLECEVKIGGLLRCGLKNDGWVRILVRLNR